VTRGARLGAGVGLTFLAVLAGLAGATPAQAHPMGNFSVNQYQGLTLYPDRIGVVAVVSTAELPTVQDRKTVDADHDDRVSDAERARYAATACADMGEKFDVEVAGTRLGWTVTPGEYRYEEGEAGLSTARLTCTLQAPAALSTDRTVTVVNRYRDDRVGWHELTAIGSGISLVNPPIPAQSTSDQLRAFPTNLETPSALLDVRTATLTTRPGADPAPAAVPTTRTAVPTSALTTADRALQRMAAGERTLPLAVAAFALALLLGAGHAVLPGHGKTVLAVYLAGRQGRPRDALAVGATVTASHTAAVLVVGLLISGGTAIAGDRLGYLGVASGLIVVAVGIGMLVRLLRGGTLDAHAHSHGGHTHGHGAHAHDHSAHAHAVHAHAVHSAHAHDHSAQDHDRGHKPGHDHGSGHAHGHGSDHDHDSGHDHDSDHDHGPDHAHDHGRRGRRFGLAGIGIAGGLVPSPSALVVLLAAIGLGRPWFGVLLTLAYGAGMAATLTAAGLLLIAVRRRVAARLDRLASRAARWTPVMTTTLVLVVGLAMAVRAGVTL
jgi:ABC-type nickel/cobalt efflux system permease component RcnA